MAKPKLTAAAKKARAVIYSKYAVPPERQKTYSADVGGRSEDNLRDVAKAFNLTVPANCTRGDLENICLERGLASLRESNERLVRHVEAYKQYAQKFERIFSFKLKPLFDYQLGLDVIALDERLGTPDGESTHDFVLRTYGKEALTMIEALL